MDGLNIIALSRGEASALAGLACVSCGREHDAGQPQNLCSSCGLPLYARYDLESAARTMNPSAFGSRPKSMWRYRELLPVEAEEDIVTLGEGLTPLLAAPRLAALNRCRSLRIKDESANPTQSFKARGMSAAISMAKQLGIRKVAVPSAGNAGSALSAYAARAGMEAHVFMPRDTTRANIIGCQQTGAKVTLVDGFITDCAAELARRKEAEGWFEVSTLREPYRLEGKKTLGFELAEQSGWELPDVVIYPTGGGSGMMGMWKAFDELEGVGLIGPKRPRMFSIQTEGCAPIVRAFEAGAARSVPEFGGKNRPSGLKVPKALGDFLILQVLRESGGAAVAVTEDDIFSAIAEMGAREGIFASPEGAAAYAGLKSLLRAGVVDGSDSMVLFNTGAGVKYLDWFE